MLVTLRSTYSVQFIRCTTFCVRWRYCCVRTPYTQGSYFYAKWQMALAQLSQAPVTWVVMRGVPLAIRYVLLSHSFLASLARLVALPFCAILLGIQVLPVHASG